MASGDFSMAGMIRSSSASRSRYALSFDSARPGSTSGTKFIRGKPFDWVSSEPAQGKLVLANIP